jgi:hypothetical protein
MVYASGNTEIVAMIAKGINDFTGGAPSRKGSYVDYDVARRY